MQRDVKAAANIIVISVRRSFLTLIEILDSLRRRQFIKHSNMHRICHVVCHDASLISHLTKFYVYLHCYLLKCKTSLSVNCSDHTTILLIVSLYYHRALIEQER